MAGGGLWESVFSAIEQAKVFTKPIGIEVVAQQSVGLPPAPVISHPLIKTSNICCHSIHQNFPRGIDCLQFCISRCEEMIVEDCERNSPAENLLYEITVQSFAKCQRPLRAANQFLIIFVGEILYDLNP